MSETIVIPIPERLFAHLIVAAPRRLPRGLPALAAQREQSRTGSSADLQPRIDLLSASVPPMPELVTALACESCRTLDAEMAERLTEAEQYVNILCGHGPTWPPLHLWTAAFTAETHAIATVGIPIDPETCMPLVDDWLHYAFADPWNFPVADWIQVVLAREDDDEVRLFTNGLGRLGLPEIQVGGLPAALGPPWVSVVNGLAQTLVVDQWMDLEKEPGLAFREIDSLAVITVADIESSVRADHRHREGWAEVRLIVDVGEPRSEETFLTVSPPEGYRGGDAKWRREVAACLALRPAA